MVAAGKFLITVLKEHMQDPCARHPRTLQSCMLCFQSYVLAIILLLGIAEALDKLTKAVILFQTSTPQAEGAFDPICNYHDVCFETPMPGLSATAIFDKCNANIYNGLLQMCAFAFPPPSPPPFAGDPALSAILYANYISAASAAAANLRSCHDGAAAVRLAVGR